MIEWVNTDSTNIKTYGYDHENNILYVQFKNGKLYEYKNVPIEYFNNMKMEESVGRYFSVAVRPLFPGKPTRNANERFND